MNFHDELELLIRARYPILYIISSEETRVQDAVNDVAAKRRKRSLNGVARPAWCPPARPSNPRKAATPPPRIPWPRWTWSSSRSSRRSLFSRIFTRFLTPTISPSFASSRTSLCTSRTASKRSCWCPVLEIPAELEKEITVLNFPLPAREDLSALLDRIMAEVQESKQVAIELGEPDRQRLLQAALGLTLGEAENVFAKIIVKEQRLSGEDVHEVLAEKQQIIRKSGLLEYCATTETFSHIGGLAVLKDWLNKRAAAFTDEARAFGLPAPKGILMLGVQGCGKSLCAKAVSTQWQLPLLRFDMGRMFGSLIGSSEENVRRAIAVAESVAPAILWVDEIDKAFAGSQGSAVADGGTTARVFGTFLTWLSEKRRRFSWWRRPTTFRNCRRNCCARAGWTKSFLLTFPKRRSGRRFSAFTWPNAAGTPPPSTPPPAPPPARI
jgi:hypothetical protein